MITLQENFGQVGARDDSDMLRIEIESFKHIIAVQDEHMKQKHPVTEQDLI